MFNETRHNAINYLRKAEAKGLSHEHALNMLHEFDTDCLGQDFIMDAYVKLKKSVDRLSLNGVVLGKYDFLCDKCGKVIVDGELCPDNHVTKDNGDTWCMDCERAMIKRRAQERYEHLDMLYIQAQNTNNKDLLLKVCHEMKEIEDKYSDMRETVAKKVSQKA